MAVGHVHAFPALGTDGELLERLLARDQAAWREFQRRFESRIARVMKRAIYRYGSVLQSADSEDMTAEFFLELTERDMHKLRAFDPTRGLSLAAWLDVLARRTAVDFLRRAYRMGLERTEYREDYFGHYACRLSPQSDPQRELEARERLRQVIGAAQKLGLQDRAILALILVRGHSTEEATRSLHLSRQSIYTRTHRIRRSLAAVA